MPQDGSDPTYEELLEHNARLTRQLAQATTPTDAGQPSEAASFQERVAPWVEACFGQALAEDAGERNHRFLEEALELVQACGCSKREAQQLVEYVFGRQSGEPVQEVGGVRVTLAALCQAHGIDLERAGERELSDIWGKVENIRAKQAGKPAFSPDA